MSIYATLWTLKFPASGDDHLDCDWITVRAQGVPQHIGAEGSDDGYDDAILYGDSLPPPVDPDGDTLRAVVFVTELTPKGTDRCGQEFVEPLLVLTGEEYERMSFDELHSRLCDALRGSQARVIMQVFDGDSSYIVREDGSRSRTDKG